MTFIGLNIGALTVKAAVIRDDSRMARVVAHQGRPLEMIRELLAGKEFSDGDYCGVSGRLGHISEVAAIQRALCESQGDFDAMASLGGESFLVYLISGGRISNVLSHNKCAAGSGEFLVQQTGRMGLGMEEAIRRSFDGRVVPLASRCSVHCKSDITHKLNRNEATMEDILHTLHDSMANKVVALLEKGQCELRRVLLIGGVTRNTAMLAALRGKLPQTEFVVLPESPWFEAWGTALLTRDEPLYHEPKISAQATMDRLPPLHLSSDRVRVVDAPSPQGASHGPMVLGVDAGSTTTKAVLMNPVTRAVVASYYCRTGGDPVAATRRCLKALVKQAGDPCIGFIGTTGSARELVGAYLGTGHVYNEISSHAAGANHFDSEVDTIFEIGGQDSKYIHLRNGVPIDYAMNNACSAGTGSFLEESAHGDLGMEVTDIARIALAAPSPVRFKATCAAFINSDIRIAQQQGYSREDIVAGLVYAIADNYLTRVKGPRPTGNKIFLQGGVALNRALGNAFAHSVGRQVVIPPNPELLGALGVALLTLQRRGNEAGGGTKLSSLAAQEMKLVSRFVCKACKMYCSIDRFEVDGRRFPFGGRCSLFENVWKRKSRAAGASDLVAQRTELLFAHAGNAPSGAQRIGIPKALTAHSLFPLYSTFFSSLGMEVVLSGVNQDGELKSNAGFCFPAQIAHGAVMDLEKRGVKIIFLPHVSHMPSPNPCRDCLLCPITQACPYVVAKAFPGLRLLSPVLDFTRGYAASPELVEMAVIEFGMSRNRAIQAWADAVHAQTGVERALGELGRNALGQALASGRPAVLLAGHSYSAFTPDASQSVGKKLSSMGITVIPADCLAPAGEGPMSWHFANQILNAVAIVKKHPNLFLLCVSNFSCTIDAFTQSVLASEMDSKPYLILEIDAHTADAGVQTRLEAFLDIVQNYRERQAVRAEPFTPCRLLGHGCVLRSNGETVALTDPCVKIHFPSFSRFHSQAIAMTARWLGLHTGEIIPLDRKQLERGLQYSSGRECLPLPILIGQLLQAHENRQPGEVIGFFMLRGGAPCVVDCYMGYFERFIAEQRLPDIFLMNPQAENDYCGFNQTVLEQHIAPAILSGDILVEMEQVLRVVGVNGSVEGLGAAWEEFVAASVSFGQFQAGLPAFIDKVAGLPRTRDPLTCPRVVVTGDFFTRFSPFFMEGVPELYAGPGIILKPVELSDLILYDSYDGMAGAARAWGMKPGSMAAAKACSRIFQPDGKEYLGQWLGYQSKRWTESYYRKLFQKSGLLVAGPNDAGALYEKAAEHVSTEIFGEAIPTVGKGLHADGEGYDGIIVIGPFNCLPFRISEAILKPVCIRNGMPILTYESDGYAVAPAFLRQVEVHIQQVLEHSAGGHKTSLSGLAATINSMVTKWGRDFAQVLSGG